jgi:hypothetical protein
MNRLRKTLGILAGCAAMVAASLLFVGTLPAQDPVNCMAIVDDPTITQEGFDCDSGWPQASLDFSVTCQSFNGETGGCPLSAQFYVYDASGNLLDTYCEPLGTVACGSQESFTVAYDGGSMGGPPPYCGGRLKLKAAVWSGDCGGTDFWSSLCLWNGAVNQMYAPCPACPNQN